MNTISQNEFRAAFSEEPMILFICDDSFLRQYPSIAKFPWNCIVTTENSNELYVETFLSSDRHIRDICTVEDMNDELMNRKQLKIVRLNESMPASPEPLIRARLTNLKHQSMLSKISYGLKYSGKVVILGYCQTSKISYDTISNFMLEMANNSIILYPQDIIENEEFQAICDEKNILLLDEECLYISSENKLIPEETEISASTNIVHCFASQRTINMSLGELLRMSSFAKLLTREDVLSVKIPKYLDSRYFYSFLKNSAYAPQWYGYSHNYYLKRYFDDDLYDKITKSLQRTSGDRGKPFLITGQTASGKSVSVAALAYRIFCEKQHPVIFMNDSMVNFSATSSYHNQDTHFSKSEEFTALDQLLQKLESAGAQSTLIIWDLSAFRNDLEKCIQLDSALKNRGRSFLMVCTAYEIIDDPNLSKFDVFSILPCLSTVNNDNESELSRFKLLLQQKAGFTSNEIDDVLSYCTALKTDPNLLAVLYYIFSEMRPDIVLGVHREASKSLSDILLCQAQPDAELGPYMTAFEAAFIRAGYEDIVTSTNARETPQSEESIKYLLKITAICSKFNLSIPSRLAFDCLEIRLSYAIIKNISSTAFFRTEGLEDGDFSYKIRTRLEAEMLMRYFQITPEKEIEIVAQLITHIQGNNYYNHGSEVRLVAELIYRLGPNSSSKSNKETYGYYYPTLYTALEKLRVEHNVVEPSLVLQEIVLKREYCTFLQSPGFEDKIDICYQLYKDAIIVGQETLLGIEEMNCSLSLRNKLLVEVANSMLQLSAIDASLRSEYYEQINYNMRMLWKTSPNDEYSHVVWFQAALSKYKAMVSSEAKIKMLADMCCVADRLSERDQDIINSNPYLITWIGQVYSELGEQRLSLFHNTLLEQGSAAGLYLMARAELYDAKINVWNVNDIMDEQLDRICEITKKYLENDEYIFIVQHDEKCLWLLMQLKWLMYNKKGIFERPKATTSMNRQQWEEIEGIASTYNELFIETNQVDSNAACNMLYILALASAQLQKYKNAFIILSNVRRVSESLNIRSRIYVKHILSNENGIPLEFSGRVQKIFEVGDRGHIDIFALREQSSSNEQNSIYYHKSQMKNTILHEGDNFMDLQVGLGFMGFSAFRGLERD